MGYHRHCNRCNPINRLNEYIYYHNRLNRRIVLISVIVGITNMIPYFGPYIGGVMGGIIIVIVNPIQVIFFAILILVIQQFDGLFLGPKILGESTGLKPLWVIFAIVVGGAIFGVLGMFLGVPVMAD